jgi:CBS domain-containing protein
MQCKHHQYIVISEYFKMMYSIALSENIGKFVSPREFITLDEDTLVAEAAKVMRDKDTSCILSSARILKNQLVL